MLCYLADVSSMCRLASWQDETTGALGMLSLQELCLVLINTAANPSLPPAVLLLPAVSFFLLLSHHSARVVFLTSALLRLLFSPQILHFPLSLQRLN